MHIEPPRASLHSMKEFASHYLMIVVSILTALGLEAIIENSHHRHAAEAAHQAIVAEIQGNASDVHGVLEADRKRLKTLEELQDELQKELADKRPVPEVLALITQHVREGIDIGLYFPVLHREAWDVAVANQSASWMDPAELRRLSAAYAWLTQDRASDIALFFDAPRFVDALTDARAGTVDPHEFLRVVHQAATALRTAVNRYDALEHTLLRAVGEPGPAVAH